MENSLSHSPPFLQTFWHAKWTRYRATLTRARAHCPRTRPRRARRMAAAISTATTTWTRRCATVSNIPAKCLEKMVFHVSLYRFGDVSTKRENDRSGHSYAMSPGTWFPEKPTLTPPPRSFIFFDSRWLPPPPVLLYFLTHVGFFSLPLLPFVVKRCPRGSAAPACAPRAGFQGRSHHVPRHHGRPVRDAPTLRRFDVTAGGGIETEIGKGRWRKSSQQNVEK